MARFEGSEKATGMDEVRDFSAASELSLEEKSARLKEALARGSELPTSIKPVQITESGVGVDHVDPAFYTEEYLTDEQRSNS